MQSSLLDLRYSLGVKYLATSPVCLLWNHQIHGGGLNIHLQLLLENWPAHFQPNGFPEAEFLGPPGDTYVLHHNGLGEPLLLDIKSIKTSEFYEKIKCSCKGQGILKMKLKYKFTFQFLKTIKEQEEIQNTLTHTKMLKSYSSKNVHYRFFAN